MVLYDDKAPGVYVQEVAAGARPIQAVGTSTAGFLGVAPHDGARILQPFAINNWTQFKKEFCLSEEGGSTSLARAVYGFFQNSGSRCYVVNLGKKESLESGLAQLERIDDVANIAAPGYTSAENYNALITHCEKLADRVAILDAPSVVTDIDQLKVAGSSPAPSFTVPAKDPSANLPEGVSASKKGKDLNLAGTGNPGDTVKLLDADQNEIATTQVGTDEKWVLTISFPKEDDRLTLVQYSAAGLKPPQSAYATFYFPWILVRDPLLPRDDPDSRQYAPPSGHIAGIWSRSDASRGVHKAPANEAIHGALGVKLRLTDVEQGGLNQVGVNCIRFFAREGIVVWGARTLAPNGEWRYLNVRRLFNMIEKSIEQSTRWIVFEPNDETLWNSISRDVTAFLTRIWRTGALMGSTAEQAFFVKCDAETNPPEEIDAGKVTIVIGIAPVKPAEFVVFQISQLAAGAEISESGG